MSGQGWIKIRDFVRHVMTGYQSKMSTTFISNVYNVMRRSWISTLIVPENFFELQAAEKFKLIFNKPENVKVTAQYILDAFNKRSKIVNVYLRNCNHFMSVRLFFFFLF